MGKSMGGISRDCLDVMVVSGDNGSKRTVDLIIVFPSWSIHLFHVQVTPSVLEQCSSIARWPFVGGIRFIARFKTGGEPSFIALGTGEDDVTSCRLEAGCGHGFIPES